MAWLRFTDLDEFPEAFQLSFSDEELDRFSERIQNQDCRPADDFQPLPETSLRIVHHLRRQTSKGLFVVLACH